MEWSKKVEFSVVVGLKMQFTGLHCPDDNNDIS
jgi:hypothetical protein